MSAQHLTAKLFLVYLLRKPMGIVGDVAPMMKISTKGRYATRAMLELALRGDSQPVQLKEVARAQSISEKYLEQLVAALKRARLVRSALGARGGYVVSKPLAQISVLHIVEAVEGSVAPVDCVDEPSGCDRSSHCVTHKLWDDVKHAVVRVLENATLKDLVRRERRAKRKALASRAR